MKQNDDPENMHIAFIKLPAYGGLFFYQTVNICLSYLGIIK